MNEMSVRSACDAGRRRALPFFPFILSCLSVLFLVLSGCAYHPLPEDEDFAQTILTRLQERRDQITSATYRVRWQARGVEPHGDFFLDIAYKSPARYRVSATGPFGIPAFTGVMIDEDFWFVDHTTGRYVADRLENLEKYEIPLSSFFADYWRDIIAGGWGGTGRVRTLLPTDKKGRYAGRSEKADWTIVWKSPTGPRKVRLEEKTADGALVTEIWYKRFQSHLPFWEMDHLQFTGLRRGGMHRWNVLTQSFNLDIPDRFFDPLLPPESKSHR